MMRFHPKHKVGGAEMQAHLLGTELANRGWDVHYLSECPLPASKPYVEDGMTLHELPLWPRQAAVLRYPTYSEHLKAIAADIYYQRVALPHTGIVARVARTTHRPFVWASAHVEDCSGAKYLRAWRQAKQAMWRRGMSFLTSWSNDRLIAYGIRSANVRVVQTVDQQEILWKAMFLPSVVIPNGHPVPIQSEGKENPPLVLWVANMSKVKQPALFGRLAAACIDLPARFVMVGRHQDELAYSEVMSSTSALPNFEYLGPVSSDEANKLMGLAAVLVNTSSAEGFPNTFIQAWMRETPVVSFVDPDQEIQQHGLGYRARDFDELVRHVRTLLTDDALRVRLGRQARTFAAAHHSISSTATLYENLFRQLLRGEVS